MRSAAKKLVQVPLDGVLDVLLTGRTRAALGRYILNREFGEGLGDPALNGESMFLRRARDRLTTIKDPVVFDVGANVGNWTLEMLSEGVAGLRLVAFEPSSATYAVLVRRARESALGDQITAECAALSDSTGEGVLHSAGELAETTSLVFREGVTDSGTSLTRCIRGDAYCERNNFNKIDFLKIDVEGHEMAVLRGFESMLRRQAIGCIQFEYGSTWIDARAYFRDAFVYLQSFGYDVGKLSQKRVRRIRQYNPILDNFRYANFVAVSPAWSAEIR